METCSYKPVEAITESKNSDNAISRRYLFRQILVCSAVCLANFSYGLSFGSPTVLIPQIRREANSSDAVSTEMASWLSSAMNTSATVNAIILAILSRLIGRKLTFSFICITSIIASIVFYCSKNITHIFICEILHGTIAASALTVLIMILTEYISPRYRGVFLTLKCAMFLWGVWVANAIGTFFHWKNIGILASICLVYCLLTAQIWPESPYWLANKNRLEDCTAAHRWLKGCSKESEAELEALLLLQKQTQSAHHKQQNFIKSVGKMFKSKTFYRPMLLCLLLTSLYHFSGKMACGMYAIDIIKRITGTETTAYMGMLILDGITILGAYAGCGLSKVLKRRTLLLVSSTVGVIFLIIMSFYLYLIHFEVIPEYTVISISLLIGYSLAISVGPMIMSTSIVGELLPVKYRSSSVLLIGCYTNFLMASIIKCTPSIIDFCGVRGLFLFFAVIESLFIIICYRVLPETKDKTILEIQDALLGTKSSIRMADCLDDGN